MPDFTSDPVRLGLAFALIFVCSLIIRRMSRMRRIEQRIADALPEAASPAEAQSNVHAFSSPAVDPLRELSAREIAQRVGLVATPRLATDMTLAEEYLHAVKHNLHCRFHLTLFKTPEQRATGAHVEALESLRDSHALLVRVVTSIELTDGAPDLPEMHQALAPTADFARFREFFRAERNICEKFTGDGLDRVMSTHVDRYNALISPSSAEPKPRA